MIRSVNSAAGVKSFIVSPTPILLYRIHGYFDTAGTTDFYIQVHNSATLPANGVVPLESYQAQANFEFNVHNIEGLPCTIGCVVVLSSTKDTLTIATVSTDKATLYTDIEEYETKGVKPLTSSIGDTTTNVAKRLLWVEASGPLKLIRVQATETAGAASFVGLYCQDAVIVGSKPIREWSLAANASLDLQFGLNGVPVYTDDANFTLRKGCTIGFSLTTNSYDGAGQGTIKGTYLS